MTPIRFMQRISSGVNLGAVWATAALTAGFAVLVFVTVLSRYVFNFSILFSQEVSKLLFIWACFMAATVTYKRKSHIRFEFIDTILKARGIAITDVLINLLSLGFFITIFVQSISFIRQIWETYFPLIGISQGWLYMSLSAASVIFIIHTLTFLMESITAPDLLGKGGGSEDTGSC